VTRKPIKTRAELETECRRIIAEMIASGEAGKLDRTIYDALTAGLRARQRSFPK